MRYCKGFSSVWSVVTQDVHDKETVDAPQRSPSLVDLEERWKRRIPYLSLFFFSNFSIYLFKPSQPDRCMEDDLEACIERRSQWTLCRARVVMVRTVRTYITCSSKTGTATPTAINTYSARTYSWTVEAGRIHWESKKAKEI